MFTKNLFFSVRKYSQCQTLCVFHYIDAGQETGQGQYWTFHHTQRSSGHQLEKMYRLTEYDGGGGTKLDFDSNNHFMYKRGKWR